jgi:putative membrane-bound dehydrogenase-like protein
MRRLLFLCLTSLLACGFAPNRASAVDAPAGKPQSPLSPEESLKWFQLDDDLRIELAACEPEVVDPVTVRFDEQGRMWVAEYRDYPNPPAPGEKPKSRIKLLEDRDGDGRFETAHVFADELLFCNGLQPWNGGVIATMSGKIAFLKDTDGDHRADVFETWYTGFAEQNPQLRVNHPRFVLDNHIYVANGLKGGEVINPRDPQAKPVSLRGHDLRFDPRTGKYEAISGNGQFGLTFDDYGNRFLCSNRNPLFHVVFEQRYLEKNPNYVVPTVVNDVAAAGEASRVYPLVEAWTTSILHAGQFTAACGIDIYRGDALPDEYRGNSFTCEPTGSLVHREILTPDGPTFKGRPAHEGREFLASRDPWFRPVFCEGGPDGALYVCDMYRAVIEHPEFVPEELKQRPDERYGEDKGRIYRIVPKDFKRPAIKNVAKASTEELVDLLEHKNAWWRETAQRLLIERNSIDAVKRLAETAVRGRSSYGKVHALRTLEGLGRLNDGLVEAAAINGESRVKEQALLVAENVGEGSKLSLRNAVSPGEPVDDRLAFQILMSSMLESFGNKAQYLAGFGIHYAADDLMRRSVVLASNDVSDAVLVEAVKQIMKSPVPATAAHGNLLRELAAATASRPSPGVAAVAYKQLNSIGQDGAGRSLSLALLSGLAKGLKGKLSEVVGTSWVELATTIAKDAKEPATQRLDACELLAFAPYDTAATVLRPLVAREEDLDVRGRAVAALAAHRDPQVGTILLDEYAAQSPKFRTQILDAMLGRPERATLLLDAIESGRIKARDLDTARTSRLLKSADAKTKARAEKLLASQIPADRAKALEDYKQVLALKADARHGKEVFKKNCATCHKIGDVGTEVGPSIADLRTKTLEQVLVDVIQPNKAIDNNFVSYTVVTTDGLTVVGLLASDTPAGVTLKLPEGKTTTILKKDIEQIASNGLSLMPEGIEKNIPHQDMADVISFVKNWRYLDGAVPSLAPAAK